MSDFPYTATIVCGLIVTVGGGLIVLYHKAPFSRIRKFKAKRAQKHDIKRYSLDAGVPRICINEETGKDTVTVRAEFKNFEKDPITISWAKCCVPLASFNFMELESHEPIVIAPLGSRHIEFEATLTPNMVEKAREKFGSDNGIRGSFQFTIKATMKKVESNIHVSKALMIELVQFKNHKTLSDEDIKILLTDWVNEQIKKDTFTSAEFDKLDRQLKLPTGSSKKFLKGIVAEKAFYQVDKEGDNFINFKKVYKKQTRRVISRGIQGY